MCVRDGDGEGVGGVGTIAPGRSRETIAWTCAFSALPVPTTAFFTSRAAYSATGIPPRAAVIKITPRA